MCSLPMFKYHPNPIETGTFKTNETVVCDCCEQETNTYYDGIFYSRENVSYLCPLCISSGKAHEKFNGTFTDEIDGTVSPYPNEPTNEPNTFDNQKAIEEVLWRTPGYLSWQSEKWLTHCNDCCAFIGYVGWDEIKDKLANFVDLESDMIEFSDSIELLEKYLRNDGDFQGYLFQCLHCRKYRLYADCN